MSIRMLSEVILSTAFSWLVLFVSANPLNPTEFSPLGDFNPTENVYINTTHLTMSGGASETGVVYDGIAVFVFEDFFLAEGITVHTTGTLPLALLAHNTMTIAGTIDVSASGSTGGPGGYDGAVGRWGTESEIDDLTGFGPGGGQPFSGGGFGGRGGSGDITGYCGNRSIPGKSYGDLSIKLQGGSGAGSTWVPGGGGGGALELGAIRGLFVTSTALIDARGFGAGGGILVHSTKSAPVIIDNGAMITADGGSGGLAFGRGVGGSGGGKILLLNLGRNEGNLSVNGGKGISQGFCFAEDGHEGSIRVVLANPSAEGFFFY